jgi:hypothetical protein
MSSLIFDFPLEKIISSCSVKNQLKFRKLGIVRRDIFLVRARIVAMRPGSILSPYY